MRLSSSANLPARSPMPKQQTIGICDLCGSAIPRGQWYTKHGPRVYCSPECRQTGNSRNGNAKRVTKLKRRIRQGRWKNPRDGLSVEMLRTLQSAASKKARVREVAEGRWRNPALSESAKRKLSRPRKHHGALHRAIEKLRTLSTQDLTSAERRAYRAYRKRLRDARRDEINRQARERYHRNRGNHEHDEIE